MLQHEMQYKKYNIDKTLHDIISRNIFKTLCHEETRRKISRTTSKKDCVVKINKYYDQKRHPFCKRKYLLTTNIIRDIFKIYKAIIKLSNNKNNNNKIFKMERKSRNFFMKGMQMGNIYEKMCFKSF